MNKQSELFVAHKIPFYGLQIHLPPIYGLQRILYRTKREICDSNDFESRWYKTSRKAQFASKSAHKYTFHGPQTRLRFTDELKKQGQRHTAFFQKRKLVTAKLAPACRIYDADRMETVE